jgi:ppGpp synthetase/RelA/SpoT-type nucleotidyltranferase
MKVNKQIRDLYDDGKSRYARLADEVRDTLKSKVEDRSWFFIARVKELPSFALKLETGRVGDPRALEDFYACTIVVPTMKVIDDAEKLVLDHFDQSARRPAQDNKTHKSPSEFTFDDLRLYVKRRAQSSGKDEDLTGVIFEVQIKTVLQYAWSIATHDLIYKTDTVSWPKERIAFQVKAMLEHAEIAISEAERISDAHGVAKMDLRTENILFIIDRAKRFWQADALPEDLKRLAENILSLLGTARFPVADLERLLAQEKARVGLIPRDLSPYAFVLQALAQDTTVGFQDKFARAKKVRLLIHDGMDIPAWMKLPHDRIINIDNLKVDL